MHRFLLHNGEIHDTTEKLVSPGQVGLLNGWGVFSTLRVRDGVLFEWERHFARMKRDAELMHIPFPMEAEPMRRDLLKLIEANSAQNATLRVVVLRNKGGMFDSPNIEREWDIIAFTKDMNKWGESVRLMTKPQARMGSSPFSGAKILSWSMNLTWLEEAQAKGFDEMLLLDEHGHVSECTSANIFVVKGNQVSTPPLRSGCLPGVTRSVVLEVIKVPGIEVDERIIEVRELAEADDVFITSSTRDLLPVHEVDGTPMRMQGTVRTKLLAAFQEYLASYVARNAIVSTGKN